MTALFDSSLAAQAARLMDSAQRIVIFTHIAPDGDAMGSSLAMWHYLRAKRGTNVSIRVITPNGFPAFLAWMPGADNILIYEEHEKEAQAVIAEADLHLCLDFNEPKRIGPVGEQILLNPCPKILIDHHLNPSDFATLTFSYPQVSSTCELVYRLMDHWSQAAGEAVFASIEPEVSRRIAISLYTGLMTDTGNFAFNSNNPDLYEIIAQLLRAGIDKDAIYDAVFNQASEDRLRLTGYALYRKMQFYPEYHLALIALSDEELQRFHYKTGDTEGLVNMPLQIADIYYSVFMREQPAKPGTSNPVIKISFRSQGDRPVNIFAREVFGGGGHKNASGGDFYGTIGRAIRVFEKHFPAYLKKE